MNSLIKNPLEEVALRKGENSVQTGHAVNSSNGYIKSSQRQWTYAIAYPQNERRRAEALWLLNTCPIAGQGQTHSWLPRGAWALRKASFTPEEAFSLLDQITTARGKTRSRECAEVVQNIYKTSFVSRLGNTFKPGRYRKAIRSGVDTDKICPIINQSLYGGLYELWEKSPLRMEDESDWTDKIIQALFPSRSRLCVGVVKESSNIVPVDTKGISRYQLIVPNIPIGEEALKSDGKPSPRAKANFGSRRFLVIEFDRADLLFDDQAAILMHLAGFAPMTLVVFSGSKSLHGWYHVANASEKNVVEFFEYAVSLGADPATKTINQYVRMPGARRSDNGALQTVYYFNPGVVK
jgi:hypothetical protein